MAVYFHKTFIRSSDYIKITKAYSSVDAVRRAQRNGHLKNGQIVGGILMVNSHNYYVNQFYGVRSWEGLLTIENQKVPEGLMPVSRIRKKIGISEQMILAWAMFNNFDAYWVAGTFFANLQKVQQCYNEQKELLSKPIQKMPAANTAAKP
jgi:hypothetical protein